MEPAMRYRVIALFSAAATAALCGAVPRRALGQAATDEVVVVTGFRPEPLRQSAGSVAVIDAAAIERRGAEHLEAVIGTTANVTMTSGASRGRFVQIRGIGDLEQFVDPKHYPSVGISLDGIDLGGIANAAMLFDVDQIDILRGPQGTRFGAGALAGQIDISSTAPSATFEGYVDAGVADYATRMLGVAAGGPMGDTLKGRIAVQQHRSDGYIENRYLGRDDTNGYDETSVRAKLNWTPSDATEFDLTVLEFDSDNGYDAFSLDNSRVTLSDAPGHDNQDLSALGLSGRWALAAGGSVELALSHTDNRIDYAFDEDWAYVGLCDGSVCNPGDGFSNTDRYVRERDDTSIDLRWLSDRAESSAPRRLDFVLGLYAEDRSETLARDYYGPFSSRYDVERMALYGQLDVPLADRLKLTVGFRYEHFDDDYADSFAFTGMSDDELMTGELALRYSVSERSLVYAVLSRGEKPGGINTEASHALPFVEQRFQDFLASRLMFRQERLTSLELGVKSRLADGRLDLSAALFTMARDDAQLESWFWDPVNFLWVGILDNADGENTGAELDLDFAVTENWQIRAAVGLLDTNIDALTTFDLDADSFVVRRDIEQAKAPSWHVFIGSEWVLAEDWRFAIDVEATDAQAFGYYHTGTIGRSTLTNLSLARTIGATELTLWARNALDENYAVHGLYFGNDPRTAYAPTRYLQLGEPRLVGLSLRRSF
jgi:outer membrane receptor protein involved in Fe transport